MAAMLFMSANAFAASVTSVTFDTTTDLLGQGLGHKATVLVLTTPAHTTNEWASVLYSSGPGDDETGADILGAQSHTWTRTALETELGTLTADTFRVLFDVSEPGQDKSLDMQTFTMVFYDAAGVVLTSTYNGPKTHFVQVGAGTGSAGFLFRVDFGTEFGNWDRVGMYVPAGTPIANAHGDHEDFSIAKVVPVPASAAIGAALLACVVTWQVVRRRAA